MFFLKLAEVHVFENDETSKNVANSFPSLKMCEHGRHLSSAKIIFFGCNDDCTTFGYGDCKRPLQHVFSYFSIGIASWSDWCLKESAFVDVFDFVDFHLAWVSTRG